MCGNVSRSAILLVLWAIGQSVVSGAQQSSSSPVVNKAGTNGKPAGLKVVIKANSWRTENFKHLCAAAGITGHTAVSRQGLDSKSLAGVEPGEVDAWFWQTQKDHQLEQLLPQVVKAGLGQNPDFRVFVQQPWLVHDGRKAATISNPDEYEHTDLDEYQVKLARKRADLEKQADVLNREAGRRVVFIVPVADGMLELRRLIKAGKIPGIAKVNGTVLFGDIMPHPGLLTFRLGSYMHFAALYKISPEGLSPDFPKDDLTEAQKAILQKLAWDIVSKYPYAGIVEPPEPLPAKNDPAGGR